MFETETGQIAQMTSNFGKVFFKTKLIFPPFIICSGHDSATAIVSIHKGEGFVQGNRKSSSYWRCDLVKSNTVTGILPENYQLFSILPKL